MSEQILEVLSNMDTLDDSQWTSDGFPQAAYVSQVLGRVVKRQEIIDANPNFNRSTVPDEVVTPPEVEPEVEGEAEPEVEEVVEEKSASVKELSKQLDGLLTKDGFSPKYQAWVVKKNRAEIEIITDLVKMKVDELSSEISKIADLQSQFKYALAVNKLTLQAKYPNNSEQDAIRNYLDSQNEDRVRRAENSQKFLANIDIKDIQVAAPIDAAMARNTKRGTTRPVR